MTLLAAGLVVSTFAFKLEVFLVGVEGNAFLMIRDFFSIATVVFLSKLFFVCDLTPFGCAKLIAKLELACNAN
jgi:hypothetical protein